MSRPKCGAGEDRTHLLLQTPSKVNSSHLHPPPPPCTAHLYQVLASPTLHYLGFFFDAHLNWSYHVEVMCNRTRASIKVLQLLGNLVHGLDHASWCLAYNTICLPVLTYGCQLWFTNKQKTLVQKLQTVQNKAVRVIVGAFHTAPHEPLHQLLSILPMDLRLMMLTQYTTLCLYRVSKESQLLKCLRGDRYVPGCDDLPLPIPNTNSSCMALCSLTDYVSLRGPRVDPFLELPPGAPYWGGRVNAILKQDDWDYKQVSEAATNLCKKGQTINIYSVGMFSNEH